MLCWSCKVHPSPSASTVSQVTPIETETFDQHDKSKDLIIVNLQAVEKENNTELHHTDSIKPFPSIHVWDSEENNSHNKNSIPLKSVIAWDQSIETDLETSRACELNQSQTSLQAFSQNSVIGLVDKATSMAHELKPLFQNHQNVDDHCEIELDEVFGPNGCTAGSKISKSSSTKRLLHPDIRDDDGASLSLSSLEDEDKHNRPSFDTAKLVISDSFATNVDVNIAVISNEHTNEIIQEAQSSNQPNYNVLSEKCVRNLSFNEDNTKSTGSNISMKSVESRSRISSGADSMLSDVGSRVDVYELQEFHSEDGEREHKEKEELAEEQKETIEHIGLLYSNQDKQESIKDDMDDNASVALQGSLGIYVAPGRWESSVEVNLDVRLGRDEWESSFAGIEGEASLDGWNTTISEIEKYGPRQNDWRCSLQEISDSVSLKSDWSSSITDGLIKRDNPNDWKTSMNKVSKLQDDRKQWRTMFHKIKERVVNKNEWTCKFNSISNRKNVERNDWSFNLTNKIEHNSSATDWGFKFNKLGSVTLNTDDWRLRDTKMLVKTDDRQTHWNTKFLKIQKKNETADTWQTRMHKIEPIPEDQTWSTHIQELSNNLGDAKDWEIKFIDIESNKENPENWEISINDVPENNKSEHDWSTKFTQISDLEDHHEFWNSSFNKIIENGDQTAFWENQITAPELKEDTWEIKFNQVLNKGDDYDWELQLNPIEGGIIDGDEEEE